MANLKRNMIELVKNPEEVMKGGEVELEKFWTPPFLPLDVTYEAMDLMTEVERLSEEADANPRDLLDMLVNFTADKAYGKQFTAEDLKRGLHAPDALQTLQEQVMFIAQGQQTNETKKFLEKKN